MNGLSTNRRTTTAASCLRTNGIDFVIRYYSETTQQPQKHLTPQEALALDAAGLRVAAVYQDRQTEVGDFSRTAGERDGRFAFQYARETGQPQGTGIFFAVDYDSQAGHWNAIKSYFEGVAAGIAAAAGVANAYKLGVYGNGFICRRLKDAGLVAYTWLSESTGHNGSASYTDWNVKQFVTNRELCGLPARSWQRCESQGADEGWSFTLTGNQNIQPITAPPSNAEPLLKAGAKGADVVTLQRLLNRWLSNESAGHLVEDGDFGNKTKRAVASFQSTHVDNMGRPLTADGEVGGLTWGALKRVAAGLPDPASNHIILPTESATWWKRMPDASHGGTARGLTALQVAVAEAAAGRGEVGGNNMGKHVEKYLNGIVSPPANWCAGFVCWCLKESGAMPFPYTVGARSILTRAEKAGLTVFKNPTSTRPLPGDIVVWWRVALASWEGHTGYVHHVEGGRIYTIEGNKTSKVEGFDYPVASMDRLLGFVRLS